MLSECAVLLNQSGIISVGVCVSCVCLLFICKPCIDVIVTHSQTPSPPICSCQPRSPPSVVRLTAWQRRSRHEWNFPRLSLRSTVNDVISFCCIVSIWRNCNGRSTYSRKKQYSWSQRCCLLPRPTSTPPSNTLSQYNESQPVSARQTFPTAAATAPAVADCGASLGGCRRCDHVLWTISGRPSRLM